jgi:ABC-type polysaccharide/polyol phosphate export permease
MVIIRLREKLIYYSIWLAFELGARRIPSFIRTLDRSNYPQFALQLLHARLLTQEGRFELAAAEYNRCLAQRPGDRQIASELRRILHSLSMAGEDELVQQILQTRKIKEPLSPFSADELSATPAPTDTNKKKDQTVIGSLFSFISGMLIGYGSTSNADDKEQFGAESFVSAARARAYLPETTASTGSVVSPASAYPARPRFNAIIFKTLDSFVNTVEIIRSTLVLILKRNYAVKKAGLFSTTTRSFLLILAHVYMWDFLGRSFPAGIANYWWVAGGFLGWLLVTIGFTRSHSKEYMAQWYYRNRIPFGAILIQDMLFEICSMALGALFAFVVLYMLNQRQLFGSPVDVDFPAIFGLLVIAYLSGISMGAILDVIGDTLEIDQSLTHFAMWPMFITSGVYESFQQAPSLAKNIMVLNPVLPVIENLRRAFDPQYSVEGLTLLYPIAFALVGTFLYIWGTFNKSQMALKGIRAR